MNVVKVVNSEGESLLHQIISLCKTFKDLSTRDKVIFDLSKVGWVFPLLILPIASHIRDTGSEYILPENHDVHAYLETIGFPEGVNSISQINKEKTYIPICVLERNNPQKNDLESTFAEMVYKVLEPNTQVKDAIYYPITELVDNIFEHSKAEEGYVFAQYYPTKKFVDLCIVDRGRGITASYKEEKNLEFSDGEAIKAALDGLSTKPEQARGYGIRTTRKIICDGLGGEFVIISGKAAFYSLQNKENIYKLCNFYWKGVIAAYRIPQPKAPIDIYEYIE